MGFSVMHKDGTTLPLDSRANCSAVVSAKQTKTLLSDDTVTIEVLAVAALDLRIGDTINVFGTTYTLNQLPQAKKTGHDEITYTLIFEGPQYALIDRVFMLPDNTVGDNLMTDLRGAVDILVENANRNNDGKQFTVAECPEGTEYKDICYTDYNCLRALQQLCTDWETEFVLKETDTAIEVHVGTFGDTFSLPFSVGRKGGMYELTRNKPSSDLVTRLYAYGGTDNLTYYRHTRLCLPGKERKQSYIENTSVSAIYGVKEGVKNFDEIYPKRTGKVTALGTTYKTFVDSTIDFNLNEKWANTDEACKEWIALRGIEDTEYNRNVFKESVAGKNTRYLIDGTTAQVHFQTGALAGYDIDIESYDNATKTVKLIPLVDANQYEFPSSTNSVFRIAEGDEYIFVGINLPDKYKTNAEEELEAAAKEHYRTCCKPQAAYTLSLSPVWLQRAVSSSTTAGDYSVFDVGDYVHVEDEPLGISADLRVQSFTRDLLSPYDYKLTIADEVEVKTIARVVGDVQQISNVIQASQIADPNRQRRAWLTAQEVLNRTFDTEGNYYSDKIAPLSIETSMLAVGARSQQLALSNVLFTPNSLSSSAPDPAHLTATQGVLHHYSIDPDGVRSWTMSALDVTGLPSDTLYVYARCQRTGAGGVFVVDAEQRIFDADPTYYYFLVGTLSSVDKDSNTRVLSLTYGSTTVNGRYVRTGRIESVDGGTYFDLDAGEIGGNIKFNADSTATREVIDSIVSGNEAVKGAISKADEAKTALDNFQAGTRNYVKGAATATRTITGGTAQKSWEFPLVDGASGMTFAKDSAIFAWVSYFVDGWTEDYAPTTSNANIGKTTGGSNNWDWYYGSAGVASGFVQVSDTTRRYWYKFRTAGYTFLRLYVYTLANTMIDKSAVIYKPMVSFGSSLADWQEAIEDTAGSVSAAQTAAGKAQDTANTASSNASTALNTANTAKTTANTANSTANAASSTANAAKTTAGEAKTTADTANNTANAAKATADEASAAAEKATALAGGINCVKGSLTPVTIKGNGASASSEMNYILSGYPGSDIAYAKGGYASGSTICLSFDYDATNYTEGDAWFGIRSQSAIRPFEKGMKGHSSTVFTLTADTWRGTGGSLVLGGKWTGSITLSHVMWAIGDKEQPWGLAAEERELDYLRQSLQEATAAQTSITGGLILSKLIGVKSSAGVVVSGINGTDSAVGNGTPMLWAGATSKDTWNNAAFRVYNSGHVDMSDASIVQAGSGGLGLMIRNASLVMGTISNGQISSPLTEIVPQKYSNITAALASRNTGSSQGSSTSYAMTPTLIGGDYAWSGTQKKNIVTIPTNFASGTMTLTVTAASLAASTSLSGDKKGLLSSSSITTGGNVYSYPSIGTAEVSAKLWVTVNGTKVKELLGGSGAQIDPSDTGYTATKFKSVTASTSESISSTTTLTISFAPGDVVDYLCEISTSVKKGIGSITGEKFTKSCSASVTSSYKTVSSNYNNVYFADGLLLSSSTEKYVAASSSASDATVMQMRSGSSLLKFTADGLMQSLNGGSTFYRANPLICSFKLWYKEATATGYGYSWIFNPKGMNIQKVTREAAGNILISHSFGLGTSYYPQGAYVCTGNTEYARTIMFDNIDSTSLRVHFMTGNNHYDPQNTGGVDYCLVYIYDFKTY